MSDELIINFLWTAIMALIVIDIILALIAAWLLKQLFRTRRALERTHPEVDRDSYGRRIRERV
jgi:ABC-type Fe3+ transport system permease subunit